MIKVHMYMCGGTTTLMAQGSRGSGQPPPHFLPMHVSEWLDRPRITVLCTPTILASSCAFWQMKRLSLSSQTLYRTSQESWLEIFIHSGQSRWPNCATCGPGLLQQSIGILFFINSFFIVRDHQRIVWIPDSIARRGQRPRRCCCCLELYRHPDFGKEPFMSSNFNLWVWLNDIKLRPSPQKMWV